MVPNHNPATLLFHPLLSNSYKVATHCPDERTSWYGTYFINKLAPGPVHQKLQCLPNINQIVQSIYHVCRFLEEEISILFYSILFYSILQIMEVWQPFLLVDKGCVELAIILHGDRWQPSLLVGLTITILPGQGRFGIKSFSSKGLATIPLG